MAAINVGQRFLHFDDYSSDEYAYQVGDHIKYFGSDYIVIGVEPRGYFNRVTAESRKLSD